MRFAYLDESGIGNPKTEPYVVVAGVIVHADLQLKALEQYLTDMITDYVAAPLRKYTHLHSADLFRGGKSFDRNTYPTETRWKILREICEIPQKFDLPVVMGFIPRASYKSSHRLTWTKKKLVVGAQSLASICCLIAIEQYMRARDEHEVAALVFENNSDAKKTIRNAQRMLKDPDFTKLLGADILTPQLRRYLPLSRIVESPLFSEKNESSILQVADAMAWAINRKLRNAEECDRFFDPIDKQLIVRAKVWADAGTLPSS